MQQWEYKAILRELHNGYWTTEMTEEVAELGRQGWELVNAYPIALEIRIESPGTQRSIERRERWIFKRPFDPSRAPEEVPLPQERRGFQGMR